MLNYEQSSAELKKALVPWKPAFTARALGASPEVSAQIGRLELYATKHFDWRSPKLPEDFPSPLELFGQLDRLSLEQRLELFAVFFPKFPDDVEATWQMFKSLPYQSGYSRKSFRASRHPQTLEQAGNWLLNTWNYTREYPEDLEWFAVWNAYLHNENLGYLFAASISAGNTRMLELLKEIASGDHPIGAVGRYLTRALLTCSNPAAWDFTEKFLLAAQRQEGLRQTILEAVDEAHPEAFRRMLRLIMSENLYRFSAVTRAAAIWLGLNVDVTDLKMIGRYLGQLLEFLDAPEKIPVALEGANAEDAYLALWASAFENALETVPLAAKLLEHPSEQHRYVAATVLLALQLPEADVYKAQILQDLDLRIAALAVGHGFHSLFTLDGAFELLEELAQRSPPHSSKESVKKPILWDWTGNVETKQNIVSLLPYQLLERPLERLLPHLPSMTPYAREHSVGLMAERAKTQPLNAGVRGCMLALVGDVSAGVRQKAIEVCKSFILEQSEIQELENLLVRKAGDLRRALLTLLSHQDGPQALESAARLTASRKTELRQAGLEVLLELKKRKMLPPEGRALARSLSLSSAAELLLQEQVLSEAEEATLEDGLGLFDPAKQGKVPVLQARALVAGNITVKLLTALDELIHQHRETPLRVQQHWDGQQDVLLGNVGQWAFNGWLREAAPSTPFPLSEVWLEWWQNRTPELRFDAQDAQRALLSWNLGHPALELPDKDEDDKDFYTDETDEDENGETLPEPPRIVPAGLEDLQVPQLKYSGLVQGILSYLQRQTHSSADLEFTLNLFENHLTHLDPQYVLPEPPLERSWQRATDPRQVLGIYSGWLEVSRKRTSEGWTPEHEERYGALLAYQDRAFVHLNRMRAPFDLTAKLALQGIGSKHDLLDALIGKRAESHSYYYGGAFSVLKQLTGRKKDPLLEKYPALEELVNRCRARVLQLELGRGNLPTAASSVVSSLRSIYGAHNMLALLDTLGKETLIRGHTSGNEGKTATFSHLLRVSFPAPEDTPQSFKTLASSLKIAPGRLLELAMFAPQWSAFVEHTLGFRSLEDGVYWLHAHTKDQNWSVDREILEVWEAEIAERTPLSPADLLEGAVDVGWFGKLYKSLGAENWGALGKAAKYASSSGGHKRAELYASALLGHLEESALMESIKVKRYQDSVRALGLLPLAKAPKKRQAQSLSRYKCIQAFLKGSKEFGAQRQASEQLAGRIGLQNLARSAGYSDPERLMWSLESAWTQSLLGGQTLEQEGVTLTLKLTELGEAELLIMKAGKKLKSVPSSIVKLPEVKALMESKKDLSSQKGRMRASLERAMCEGHLFASHELPDLWAHPILKPLLEKLVWVNDTDLTGLLDPDLEHLVKASGERVLLGDSSLRIAHPTDLYRSGDWMVWQASCVENQLEQPFKQVFRELYISTAAEKDSLRSKRYAGHSVNPRQALALLKARQWVTVPEEGVRKTLHSEGISVWLNFEEGFYTPAELEGLTLEGVYFTEKGKYVALELASVNPRVFSEVMRDLDLVVSVAHLGGVDPEASASTVEMRQNLLRETLRLLKIENVRLEGQHALIAGHLGDYTIHLGSAGVHRQPGGSLCILPVHAQHNGRIFLPFADSDPRTAEVISKVLLLAKDREIKDPTILEQLI